MSWLLCATILTFFPTFITCMTIFLLHYKYQPARARSLVLHLAVNLGWFVLLVSQALLNCAEMPCLVGVILAPFALALLSGWCSRTRQVIRRAADISARLSASSETVAFEVQTCQSARCWRGSWGIRRTRVERVLCVCLHAGGVCLACLLCSSQWILGAVGMCIYYVRIAGLRSCCRAFLCSCMPGWGTAC